MAITVRRSDWIVVGIVAATVVLGVVYSAVDNVRIQQDLERIALEKAHEYLGDQIDHYEFVTLVKASRGFPIFGNARGGIHLFIREKGDKEMRSFKGIEYYCKRVGNQWAVIDSAGCSALEHHCAGFKEMEAKGLEVSPSVYERMNRN